MIGGRVLVAEDESVIRLDVRSLLEAGGYEVCAEAHDGLEAVKFARQFRPDLVVMDVNMPRLGGPEAAAQMKRSPNAPRVVLMSLGFSPAIGRAVAAGDADGFCAKPDIARDLLPLLQKLFPANGE